MMKDSMPKISVIVPVYKAESYLHRCVDSILAQTFTDFEVLLIDDGSPDKSGVICDEYAKKDSRVHVFHKENGGVSSARQCGIDNAQGEYTIHADPDDWVEPNMLEELYCKAKEADADMVICDFLIEKNEQKILLKQRPSGYEKETLLNDILSKRLHGSCCNKLVKRSCYNLVTFPHNLNCNEDTFVIMHMINNGTKVVYLNRAYYHYCMDTNPTSIIKGPKINLHYQSLDFMDRIEVICPVHDFQEGFAIQYAEIATRAFCCGVYSTKELSKNVRQWNKEYNFREKLSPLWKLLFLFGVNLRMYRLLLHMIHLKRKLG